MENASKALLMAAGLLIGMLVISLAVYLFTSFSGTAIQISQENAKKQVDQFNSQFTSLEGKSDITIYDVVSIANLATENNIYYEFPTRLEAPNLVNGQPDNYISVSFTNRINRNNERIERGTGAGLGRIDYDTLIQEDLGLVDNTNPLPNYNCTTRINPQTRKSLFSNFCQNIKNT